MTLRLEIGLKVPDALAVVGYDAANDATNFD